MGAFAGLRSTVVGLARVLGLSLSTAYAAPLSRREQLVRDGDDDAASPLWVLAVASMVLVLLGGAFAGLTIAQVPLPPPDVVHGHALTTATA